MLENLLYCILGGAGFFLFLCLPLLMRVYKYEHKGKGY